MIFAKRITGIGLSALGLALGLLCLGRAVETAIDDKVEQRDRQATLTTGLGIGIPTTLGALWMLRDWQRGDRWDRLIRHKLIGHEPLQAIFCKALKANNGKINPIQFALLGQISLAEAQACLKAWADPLGAKTQVDEAGVVVYCFNLVASDSDDAREDNL
jgi:hypothetical protein